MAQAKFLLQLVTWVTTCHSLSTLVTSVFSQCYIKQNVSFFRQRCLKGSLGPVAVLVQATCVRHTWWRTKRSWPLFSPTFFFFLFLSFSSFYVFWSSPTSGNLPCVKICFPQYFGITRICHFYFFTKKYWFSSVFSYFLFKLFQAIIYYINTPGTRGWSRLRDRTLAVPKKRARISFFS